MRAGFGSKLGAVLVLLLAGFSAQAATITYDSWETNEGFSGSYIFTVNDDIAGQFNYNLTVDPWDAEVLGLFLDLGDTAVGSGTDTASVTLSNVNPAGEVVVYAINSSGTQCGQGCGINGLNPALSEPNGNWELIFRLADNGFDGIQAFSWSTADFGLNLSSFGLVAIRAQQQCGEGSELTTESDSGCGGSDKSFGFPTITEVPEPATLGLMVLGLLAFSFSRRRKTR